ncbi:MAG: hypothetical protein JXR36_04690 [Bacteroidales bacterium]|nr:hypothetical protein [Bacteroidales bacterium]
MKAKALIFMILTATVFSCGDSKIKSNTDNSVVLNPVNNKTDLNFEITKLKEKGVVGKWECSFTGYESIIYLIEKEDSFIAEIDFQKDNAANKTENLIVKDDKYYVKNSAADEYYKINDENNLEMWDKDGLFTTAINIMPGQDREPLPPLKLKDTFRKDVHFVADNYSKSPLETLSGTDSDIWIVYLKDIDVTFRVYKKTNTIEKAAKGRINNLK